MSRPHPAPSVALDPLETTQRIAASYRRYLLTTFGPRRPDLWKEFVRAIEHGTELTKGPFLQASAPFQPGRSLAELISEGVLDDRFRRLSSSFPLGRPLHLHQETAIRKATRGRNLVVSTGTGSGKTETFLLPILDHLFAEARAGTLTRPGVRALLLYPMNALANDQLKRLRRLLAGVPEITFGRYTGETKQTYSEAVTHFRDNYPDEPELDNELLSRAEMQERPPHLLLTNFAMLEYLLLRPHNHRLFDGDTAAHWRFLVLDEAHVYDGAKGAEVAMLLRRLRDRVKQSRRGEFRCFATSATLGRGVEDHPKLVEFATKLFDEHFEWIDDDLDRQDVVTATRLPLVRHDASYHMPAEAIASLREAQRWGSTSAELAAIAQGFDASVPASAPNESAAAYLHRLLRHDQRLIDLQRELDQRAQPLVDLAIKLFGSGDSVRAITDLVDLAVVAREQVDDAPLLPARYHYFVRALEGAFVCLHGGHQADTARLQLARHTTCPSCAANGRSAPMFEVGICKHCRAVHLIGRIDTTDDHPHFGPWRSRDSDERRRRDVLLLGDPAADDDEDEAAQAIDVDGNDVSVRLCPGCGAFAEAEPGTAVLACQCIDRPDPVSAILVKPAPNRTDGKLTTCRACRARDTSEPVGPLLTGNDAPVAVIATDLYQQIPPSPDEDARYHVGQGRKLLCFADSRQDAAFFAPYLDQSYQRGLQRRLIAEAAADLAVHGEHPRTDDVAGRVRRLAEDALVIDPDESIVKRNREVAAWLMEELLGIGRRNSLENAGVLEIAVAVPRQWRPPRALLTLGFTEEETLDLIQLLLATVRQGGALTALEGVTLDDERFAPRNREVGIRRDSPGRSIISWLPGRNGNRRIDLMTKVLAAKGSSADPRQVLEGLWAHLTEPASPWKAVVSYNGPKGAGKLWRLDSEWFELIAGNHQRRPYRCSACGQLTWRTITAVCPTRGCPGAVEEVNNLDQLRANHYHRMYRELDPIGLSVQEHTAQWTAEEAARIQDRFVRGMVNALSCSTTFELGVDVGDVQAVLLRNMPPSPANYVQRAGRAGRRTEAAALVVTFAQRRNHDRSYFHDPTPMIEGTIAPPVIEIENPFIVRRHVHSVAFAAFERRHFETTRKEHRNVADFFLPQADRLEAAADEFLSWLRTRPQALGEALRRIVPPDLASSLGLDDWVWVEALVTESDEEPTWGWLARARGIRDEIERLDDLIEEAAQDKDERRLGRYKGMRRYLAEGRRLIDFLASRNVLPKYGFPVDVVELDVYHGGDTVSAKVELQRDLQLAISEYAPGNEVVAAKWVWQSRGLKRRPDKEWPHYVWALCPDCGHYMHDPSVLGPCGVCGSTTRGPGQGRIIEPVYGFLGEAVRRSGEQRPTRQSTHERYFGSYRVTPEEPQPIPGLPPGSRATRRRSRQGEIAIVNQGPQRRGFKVCHRCGYAAPALDVPRPKRAAKKGQGSAPPPPHPDLRRPGRECNGILSSAQLGHRFLTDVLEVRLGVAMDELQALSTLHALLEAVSAVGISRGDVDGTLHRFDLASPPAFVIYDSVPGGAGHSLRLGDELPALFAAAHRRVDSCDCGKDTSCYGCLRSYSNQYIHDELSRGAALSVLAPFAEPVPGHPVLDDIFDLNVRALVAQVLAAGAPAPLAGQYHGSDEQYLVEASWPAPLKVAIVCGEDADRDAELVAQGWNVVSGEGTSTAELLRLLGA